MAKLDAHFSKSSHKCLLALIFMLFSLIGSVPETRTKDTLTVCIYLCIYIHLYSYVNVYLIVITWAQVVCLIYTPKVRGPQASGLRVNISGKPQVHMV